MESKRNPPPKPLSAVLFIFNCLKISVAIVHTTLLPGKRLCIDRLPEFFLLLYGGNPAHVVQRMKSSNERNWRSQAEEMSKLNPLERTHLETPRTQVAETGDSSPGPSGK